MITIESVRTRVDADTYPEPNVIFTVETRKDDLWYEFNSRTETPVSVEMLEEVFRLFAWEIEWFYRGDR